MSTSAGAPDSLRLRLFSDGDSGGDPPVASAAKQQQQPAPASSAALSSFQAQLRAIAFGGRSEGRSGSGRSVGMSAPPASRRAEKPPRSTIIAEAAAAADVAGPVKADAVARPEGDEPSSLDLIARLRDRLIAFQAAPASSAGADADERQSDGASDGYGRENLVLGGSHPGDYDDYEAAAASRGPAGAGTSWDGYEADEQQNDQEGQRQRPGTMLREVRARWAAQREEEQGRLREMSSQRQLEAQLRDECRLLTDTLHEKQLEVQSMSDHLELLQRLNEQTKADLMAAVENGNYQTSELKLVIEEDRQVLEETRRENLELKSKIEGDEFEMQGLEGRLGSLERQLQGLQGENCRLAQQLRETALSVQATAQERQEAGRLRQQLVGIESELMRLRREMSNQQLSSAEKAATAALAAEQQQQQWQQQQLLLHQRQQMQWQQQQQQEQQSQQKQQQQQQQQHRDQQLQKSEQQQQQQQRQHQEQQTVATRLQRALQMPLSSPPRPPTEPPAQPPPLPRSLTPPPPPPPLPMTAVAPPVPPRPQQPRRNPEDEQISNRVRGFLARLTPAPPPALPPRPRQLMQPDGQSVASRRFRPPAAPRQQQQQQQQQQPRQSSLMVSGRSRSLRLSAGAVGVDGGKGGGGGGGSSVLERLKAEFRDAHSDEMRRLMAAAAATTDRSGAPTQEPPALPWRTRSGAGQQGVGTRRRSAASSVSTILQGLDALGSFRGGAGGAGLQVPAAGSGLARVPRLPLDGSDSPGRGGRSNLRDYSEAREMTASARMYADSLVSKYLSQQRA